MLEIKATLDCGFGNGTRKRGFVFGNVSLNGENKLFQLLKEIRDPTSGKISQLKTAKVELSEGVTKREFGMALNNMNVIEAVEPTKEFSVASFMKLKAKDAIALVESLTDEEKTLIRQVEKRKGVLDALGDEPDAEAWKTIATESLEISDDTKLVLLGLELKTIGDVQSHVNENDGAIEGLSDEMTTELFAAMKPHITGEV